MFFYKWWSHYHNCECTLNSDDSSHFQWMNSGTLCCIIATVNAYSMMKYILNDDHTITTWMYSKQWQFPIFPMHEIKDVVSYYYNREFTLTAISYNISNEWNQGRCVVLLQRWMHSRFPNIFNEWNQGRVVLLQQWMHSNTSQNEKVNSKRSSTDDGCTKMEHLLFVPGTQL